MLGSSSSLRTTTKRLPKEGVRLILIGSILYFEDELDFHGDIEREGCHADRGSGVFSDVLAEDADE